MVLECNGRVEVRTAGTPNWVSVKPGAWLRKDDRVRAFLKSDAHILQCDDVVVKTGANEGYTVGRDTEHPLGPASPFWVRLVDSAGAGEGEAAALECAGPKDGNLLDGEFELRWKGGTSDRPYRVAVQDEKAQTVWSLDTTETVAHVSAKESPLARGKSYTWTVSQEGSGDGATSTGRWKVMTRSEAARQTKGLRRFVSEHGDGLNPGPLLVMRAAYCASHTMSLEADRAIREAESTAADAAPYPAIERALRQPLPK
jgi:hypothetical protein